MYYVLYRYWIMPSCWRRWPSPARWMVVMACIGIALWLGSIPLLRWLPERRDEGIRGFDTELSGMLFLALVDIGSAIAGATVLAGERERGTWELLLLTRLGIARIVRAKIAARAILAMGVVALMLPFWLAWAYETLAVNASWDKPFYTDHGRLPTSFTALRMGIFLLWLAVRILGRVVSFVTLGAAISARCKRVRTALIVTTGTIFVACVLIWFVLVEFGAVDLLFPALPKQTVYTIVGWPLLPNDWEHFTPTNLISTRWRVDLLNDILWIGALPWSLYGLAVYWSKRRGVDYRTLEEVERRQHEF